MNGGGGQQGTELGNWSEGLRGPWAGLIQRAIGDSEQPYSNFFNDMGQSRVVGDNADQREGMQYTRELARNSSTPFGAMNGARGEIEDTLGGDYLGQNPATQQANPWTNFRNDWATVGNWYNNITNPYADQQTDSGGAFSAQRTDPGTNAFQGMDNPYFRQVTQQGIGDLVNAHQQGASANTNRMAVLSGAFGGSAHQQKMANDQAGLEKSVGNYLSGMQNQQYDRSAGLDESRLGRAFQGQQFDTNIGAQSFENAAQRGLQASLADKQLGGGWYNDMLNRSNSNVENYLNRATNATETGFNRGAQDWQMARDREMQAWEGERGRMMGAIGAGQNEQNLAYQRAQGMMGIGDFQRGIDQQRRDESYNNWFDERNWNRNQDAWLAGILSGAQGGLPPSQVGGGASPWANAIGTGLAAYGMFRG